MADAVELAPDVHQAAAARAEQLGIPLADYLARLVQEDCDGGRPTAAGDHPWRAIFGIGDSGGSDVARYKDEYLGEAVEADVFGEAVEADNP